MWVALKGDPLEVLEDRSVEEYYPEYSRLVQCAFFARESQVGRGVFPSPVPKLPGGI